MNLERNKKTHKYDSKNKTIYVQRAAIKKATVGFPFKSSRVKNESKSGWHILLIEMAYLVFWLA